MNSDTRTIAFVLYPGLTPLDLVGPLQVMSGLEVVEAAFGLPRRHHVVVVAEDLNAVATDTPVRVAATTTLDEVPEPDIVMVPGGGAPTLRQLANPVLLDYLRNADRTSDMVTSVCTGSLLLAGAGLLQGRPATTHWPITVSWNASGQRTCPSAGSRTATTSPAPGYQPESIPLCDSRPY
jgi:putative intracellular protease/amidase